MSFGWRVFLRVLPGLAFPLSPTCCTCWSSISLELFSSVNPVFILDSLVNGVALPAPWFTWHGIFCDNNWLFAVFTFCYGNLCNSLQIKLVLASLILGPLVWLLHHRLDPYLPKQLRLAGDHRLWILLSPSCCLEVVLKGPQVFHLLRNGLTPERGPLFAMSLLPISIMAMGFRFHGFVVHVYVHNFLSFLILFPCWRVWSFSRFFAWSVFYPVGFLFSIRVSRMCFIMAHCLYSVGFYLLLLTAAFVFLCFGSLCFYFFLHKDSLTWSSILALLLSQSFPSECSFFRLLLRLAFYSSVVAETLPCRSRPLFCGTSSSLTALLRLDFHQLLLPVGFGNNLNFYSLFTFGY